MLPTGDVVDLKPKFLMVHSISAVIILPFVLHLAGLPKDCEECELPISGAESKTNVSHLQDDNKSFEF